MQAHRNDEVLAVGSNGPCKLVLTEIGGDLYREQSPLPTDQEVGWLPLIRPAGIDAVARPDRYVEFLLGISVVIAQKKAEGSVGVLEPALEGAGDTGARFMLRFQRQ